MKAASGLGRVEMIFDRALRNINARGASQDTS